MSNIVEVITLENMPFDAVFCVNGNEELCHATGKACRFDGDTRWYNVYLNSEGEFEFA